MLVTIDGTEIEVAPGTTVLEAIHALGQDVPTLCYDERQAAFRSVPRVSGRRRGRSRPDPSVHDAVPRRDGD